MEFVYACGVFNVFNVIDGSCILLSQKLNKWVIVVLINIILNKQVVIQFFCKQFWIWRSCFEIYVVQFLVEWQMGANSKCFLIYFQFQT
jgi:hypothetical protein